MDDSQTLHPRVTVLNGISQTFSCLMMRHTKAQKFNSRGTLLKLPKRSTRYQFIDLPPDQRRAYGTLAKIARTRFDRSPNVVRETLKMMALLVPLRRALSGGIVDMASITAQLARLLKPRTPPKKRASAKGAKEAEEDTYNDILGECTICLCEFEDPVQTICRHLYCRLCIKDFINRSYGKSAPCPQCRKPLQMNEV